MISRILRFPLTLLLIEAAAIIGLVVLVAVGTRAAGLAPGGPLAFGIALATAGLIVLAWKGLMRWLERGADRDFAFPGAARELGAGLAFGFALFSTMTGVVAVLGGFEVLGLRGQGALWSMLAMAVTSGTFEETLFRGILFRHIETMLGSWAALGLTALLFGAAHLANPGASAFAAFAIMMEAGILLGAAYMVTRRLWLAVGIHAAWNFTQGWVFSVPVSGGEAPLGLLITRRVGPDWLTGGEFGLEASVVAMIVATLAGVVMLRRAVLNGQVRPPMWKQASRYTKL